MTLRQAQGKPTNDQATALESFPDICDLVVHNWDKRFENFNAFEREMNWMSSQLIKASDHDNDYQAVLEELTFIRAFGSRQMIDDLINEPEAA